MADQRGLSGSVLAVVRDSVVVNLSRGTADRERGVPCSDTTVFPIASLTKLFVHHAALQLIVDGRIRLTERVSSFFPEIPGAADMTVADLIQHSSGIPDLHNEVPEFDDWRSVPRTFHPDEAIRRIVALGGPRFPPGTERRYSNSNYLILSRILEIRSGRTLDTLLRERIFQPYGMNRSGLYDRFPVPGHAQCSMRRDGVTETMGEFDFRHFWGSGNAYSTTTDLLAFARGVRVSMSDLHAEALSAHTGRYGGIRSAYRTIPELGVVVVVLANDDRVDAGAFLDDILRAMLPIIAYPISHAADDSWAGQYHATYLNQTMHFQLRYDGRWLLNDVPLIPLTEQLHAVADRGLLTVRFSRDLAGSMTLLLNDNGNLVSASRIDH